MSENRKKIVIVGGGIAGLSAGIYGKLAGYDVDIYEKNPSAGGQCMGWNRRGCHIDNCIHWLTGTKKGTALRKVWETVGALDEYAEFAECDSFYTSRKGDCQVTLWKDLERTQKELIKLSPEDETEIKKSVEHVRYAAECEIPAEKPILDCWTLMTYERYCNAYHGAYMGFITKKGVKSFRVKGKLKGVKNLYIASQWIMAPGGLPVAVTAGKFADQIFISVSTICFPLFIQIQIFPILRFPVTKYLHSYYLTAFYRPASDVMLSSKTA